ncbi:hypothetical protein [Sphingobacterium sp. LRF_L2]|uniref:hypothetical protein n=1 Tax=Sphingobacterium sp. LRF_L2 TaxID=3369421 RepID=UPI003F5E3161
MNTGQQEMIVGDFEKFMRYMLAQHKPFSLEIFVSFATSLVNFYQGSNLIRAEQRHEAAFILAHSFNAGIGQQISTEDLQQIVEIIITDLTVDYSILNPIFG